jgi:hypothetical protein
MNSPRKLTQFSHSFPTFKWIQLDTSGSQNHCKTMVSSHETPEKGSWTNCLLSGRSQVQLPPRTLVK